MRTPGIPVPGYLSPDNLEKIRLAAYIGRHWHPRQPWHCLCGESGPKLANPDDYEFRFWLVGHLTQHDLPTLQRLHAECLLQESSS